MGPVARKIVDTARANPEWTFDQIATHCGSTHDSVKVVLCAARRDNLIRSRPGDGRPGPSPTWLPDAWRADYRCLRVKVGAVEAQRMIRDEMLRHGGPAQVGA